MILKINKNTLKSARINNTFIIQGYRRNPNKEKHNNRNNFLLYFTPKDKAQVNKPPSLFSQKPGYVINIISSISHLSLLHDR